MRWEVDNDWIPGTGYRKRIIFLRVPAHEAPYLLDLIPIIRKKLLRQKNRYEHFNGLHEIGEATTVQQTKMIEAANEVATLEALLRGLENLNDSKDVKTFNEKEEDA
jgi:hypothetical protein